MNDEQSKISILLVDDQSLIRRGLKAILNLEAGLQVIGEAENGESAIQLVEELKPDVVLMDVRMPVMDGVAA
ncbi:MAG: response regulator transcription factor, partial [Coleofasciculaceae cyanobacterium]